MHDVQRALIQTLMLCYNLYKLNDNTEKVAEYGIKIITWLRERKLKKDFIRQMDTMEREFTSIGNFTENKQYCVNDIIEVRIIEVQEKFVVARIDKSRIGRIYLSEITERWVTNIYDEFRVGETCKAKIIRIDGGRISLSTKGLRD
jgi:ribosomal protein S1